MLTSHFSQGNQLLREGKVESAISAYQEAINQNPNFYWAHHNLGEALEQLEHFDRAVAAYQKAIELKPEAAWSYFKLSIILSQLGKRKEAEQAKKKAVELEPSFTKLYTNKNNSKIDILEPQFKKIQSTNSKFLSSHKKNYHNHNEQWCYSIPESELLKKVRKYNLQKPNRKAKVVLYTAIIDNYDPLIIPETIVNEWDYVVFSNTEIPGEHIFEVRQPEYNSSNPTRIARYIKTHPHIYFSEYEYSIWIDANILVRGSNLLNAVNKCINHDIAMMCNPHHARNCIYEELQACLARSKDDPSLMEEQVARYQEEGMPHSYGMFETGIFIRKHNQQMVREFNEAWWQEIDQGSIRDQLSITYVLWKKGIECKPIPGMKDIRIHENNDYCLFLHGGKSSKDLPAYSQPSFVKTGKVNQKDITDQQLLERVRKYLKTSKSTNKKVVVYTAISNNYDILKIPKVLCPEWDYVCFTDRYQYPGEHPWQIRHFDYIHADPTRTSRYVKTHPHIYFPEYEYSIWIDAHLLIETNFLENFTNEFIKNNELFAAVPHPFRDCTYQEADLCIQQQKDDKDIIYSQMATYRKEGFPTQWGLVETGILIRKHNDKRIRKLNNLWWREIDNYSKRDQLSLMFALWKLNLKWIPLMKKGFSTRNHEGFRFFQHGLKSTKRDPVYRIPSFLPKEFAFNRTPFWTQINNLYNPGSLQNFYHCRIDIIICVHNALEDVQNCINSVISHLLPAHKVIIVDDGSDQATKDYLINISTRNSSIHLIRHNTAKGYTKSANTGMKATTAPFIILVNSDAIVSKNWSLKLLQTAYSAPLTGIVGPMSNAASWQSLPLLRNPHTGEMMVNELPKHTTIDDMNQFCEQYGWFGHFPRVPLINGFCYGIKREVIETIGYFDEETFPRGYGEEDDYSMRALNAGFTAAIATHCYVFHAKSKSFGKETRSLLAKEGGKVLCARHGEKRIQRAVLSMQSHPLLKLLRTNVGECCGIKVPERDKPTNQLSAPPSNNIQQNPQENTIESSVVVSPQNKFVGKYNLNQLTEIDSEIFPPELLLAKISLKEVKENAEFVKNMKEKKLETPKKALWIIPDFRNILAGGIRTVFIVAEEFSRSWNTQNIFVIQQTSSKPKDYTNEQFFIKKYFPKLNFQLIPFNLKQDVKSIPQTDIAFCSSWPTAYLLARYNDCKAKFYFMQDYESLFYPAGSLQGTIEQTYRFGFHCIANSLGIAEKYKQYGGNVTYFTPGVDRSIYYPKPSNHEGPPWQVVFYGRPRNKRNAFALGIETLKIVKSHLKEDVKIVSVGSKWKPKWYGVENVIDNLGVLDSMEKVAQLYRNSHVGLVFMLTPHPSYQPLEYMASGCATVSNVNPGTSWLLKHEQNALLSSVLPEDVAQNIIRLLKDNELRRQIINGGLDTVKQMDWNLAFDTIKKFVVNANFEF